MKYASKKERPISYPPKDTTEDVMTAVHAPLSYSFIDRRKSIPATVLEKEIADFSARKKGMQLTIK